MAAELTTMRLRIRGRVQGVGYRVWAAAEAKKHGLRGWVRNRSDGTVELLASGERKTVEAFIAACARGPAGARVENFDMRPDTPPAEEGFRMLATV